MTPVLLGRDHALRALRAGLDDALTGRGTVASISGEAGIGKSALASAIAAEAERRGAVVTWGRAWEFADAPPYFPLWACLRTLGVDASRQIGEARSEGDVFHLWEAVIPPLASAAAKAPVVWVLEDLHAADLGTLDLLTFLAQPLRAMRALVVATVRTPDPRLTDRAMQRLTRIARDGIDVRLDALSPADVSTLTAEAVGRALPGRELARVMELTGGNPLFVVECARAFRAAGGVEGTLGSLPSTIRQVVVDRLTLLPDTTRETLVCGAVLGREFSAGDVARMRESLPARVIDALLPALRAGILLEPTPGSFLFSHAVVRDAIEGSVDSGHRAKLHGQADVALAAHGDSADVLVERARHALAALPIGDGERALSLAERAIALLEHEGAFDRAFDLLARVEQARAAGFVGPATAAHKMHHARIARSAGRSDVSRRLSEEIVAWARGAGDAEMLAEAALLLGVDVRPGFLDRAQVALLEEARSALGDDRVALRSRVLARLATALQPAPDPTVPFALTREAVAMAHSAGDEAALLEVLDLAAWGFYNGPLHERIGNATELRDRALAHGDLTRALAGHINLALYRLEGRDFQAFGNEVDRMLAVAEAIGHPRQRWRALLLASMRALTLGHFAESERYVTELIQLAALVDDPALPLCLGLHEIMRARLQRRDEELRERMAVIDELWRGTQGGSISAAILRASCAARLEDKEAARAALALVGSRMSMVFVNPMPTALAAEAYAFAGTAEERRTMRDAVGDAFPAEVSGQAMSFSYEGTRSRLAGLLDASLGDLAAAERELRDAHVAARERGHVPWVAQTGYELARVVRLAGREAEARGLFTEACQIARDLGMSGLERSAGRALVVAADANANVTPSAPAAPSRDSALSFERSGSEVSIRRGSTAVTVKDSRGMQLLGRLLERPNEEIHVLALASDEPLASVPETSAGEMLDEAAKRAYRTRLADLDAEIAEAERNADLGRLASLRTEREALLAELARAVGLGGRARQAGSATERARVNVQRRLRDAVAKIGEANADLGRFFERTLRTGTFCCFRPD